MNIPQYLVRDADFMALREALGVSAMHALVAIGTTIQGKRSNRLKIANPAALARICDLAGEVDSQLLWDSLIGSYLVSIGEGEYSMPIWDEWNRQLIAAWDNGAKRKGNRIEANGTEPNGMKENLTEGNRIELDAKSDAYSDARGNAPLRFKTAW